MIFTLLAVVMDVKVNNVLSVPDDFYDAPYELTARSYGK